MQKIPNIMYIYAIFGGLAGLLYGFDSGAISPAIPFITEEFGLSPSGQGLIVSFLLLGALPAIVLSTSLSKVLGRKSLLIGAGITFIVGSIGCAFATNVSVLIASRFILGIGCGIANMCSLIYLVELAPPKIRGLIGALYQLSVNVGILSAYIVGASFSASGSWRIMLGIGIIPAAIFTFGMLISPESPRWLMAAGKEDRARKVLMKLRGTKQEVEDEISDINHSLKQQSVGFKHLVHQYKKILNMNFILTFFQVFTGINAVVYFAPIIFEGVEINGWSGSNIANFGIGTALVVSTAISLFIVDKLGRKTLLIYSIGGQVLPLIGLALFSDYTIFSMVCVFLYVFAFGIGLGPVFWLFIPEVLPLQARAIGMGVITFLQYTLNFLFSYTFPPLLSVIGNNVFLIYAFLSVVACVFIHYKTPETKGKSLEEIEEYWREQDLAKAIKPA
ncbi:sugar porter family MFS transporter [Peribacillus frigoritolerans]|uniref:sugar porter family MFS transporter n=1 Tax=Peribacillus frigoritolerans TaxID=450367 RepID=UPI0021AA6C9C|nr:sugar porter family MFS transporter [Peribacillus frigoritolerans]MCT4479156.1 sugar porter family MFS transporter [Peribacillus frigoritolerans]